MYLPSFDQGLSGSQTLCGILDHEYWSKGRSLVNVRFPVPLGGRQTYLSYLSYPFWLFPWKNKKIVKLFVKTNRP